MTQPGDWKIVTARSGDPTALVNGTALHSRIDPVREAEQAAARVPRDAAVVVLGGLGLGYVAEALLRAAPDRPLVIADADADLPTRIGTVRSLAPLANLPNVTILCGGRPEEIGPYLTAGPTGSRIHLILWQPSVRIDPAWYRRLETFVEESSRRRAVNARTLERFGRLWVRNLAANAYLMASAISLEPWRNRFTKIPALVLAGGPTLEYALPWLDQLRKSHLIITVDTALPAMLRHGVRPDVIAAVDPQYWNTRHLDRCGRHTAGIPILAETATHPVVFRSLGGRPWLMRSRFPLGTILEDAAGIRGELKAGGSVATAAWDLAVFLGCSPVTAAGLDLGFPGDRTHYTGSLSRERPHLYSTRVEPVENSQFRALRDGGLTRVEAASGATMLSDCRMDIYWAWFTQSVASIPDREPSRLGADGRKIDGMKSLDIGHLLKRTDRRKRIDDLMTEIRTSPADSGAEKRIASAMRRISDELGELASICGRGKVLASEALRSRLHGNIPAGLLEEMSGVDREILSVGGREVVSFLLQPLILEITTGSGETDPLDTSLRLYSAVVESAEFHREYLQRALQSAAGK